MMGMVFRLELKRQLRSVRTWLIFVLLPLVLVLAAALAPEAQRSAEVSVGVVLPEAGAEPFWQLLQMRENGVVRFLPSDLQTVERQVSTGQWDCGLVLPEDFAERLEEGDTRDLVAVYISDGSTVYPLVKETAAACLAELLAPRMAEEYMQAKGITPNAERQWKLPEEERVQVRMTAKDGAVLKLPELADAVLEQLLRGIIGIILAVWSMLCAVDQGKWLQTGAGQRFLPLRSVTALLLPRTLAAAVPVLVSASIGTLLLHGGFRQWLALAAYLAVLCAMALLAARIQPVWQAFPVLMPFVPAAGLLLSPILLDLGSGLNWLPLNLYLTACGGAEIHVLWLWLMALGLVGVSCGLDWRKKACLRHAEKRDEYEM